MAQGKRHDLLFEIGADLVGHPRRRRSRTANASLPQRSTLCFQR